MELECFVLDQIYNPARSSHYHINTPGKCILLTTIGNAPIYTNCQQKWC
eukprot:Gb_35742 [translate_table: standard]